MAFYDNFSKRDASPTKAGMYTIKFWHKYFTKKIKQKVNKDKIKILEIGPGLGYFAKLTTQDKKFQYSAIEINNSLAQNLRDSGLDVAIGSVPPINTNRKYDVIYLNQVFEHMPNWNIALELVEDIKTKLNKNGLAIIICPDIEFWGTDFFLGDYTHSFPTSKRALCQVCTDAELNIIEIGNYTLISNNIIFCKIITIATKLSYNLGIFDILFGSKSFKIKSALLPSAYVILQKK